MKLFSDDALIINVVLKLLFVLMPRTPFSTSLEIENKIESDEFEHCLQTNTVCFRDLAKLNLLMVVRF